MDRTSGKMTKGLTGRTGRPRIGSDLRHTFTVACPRELMESADRRAYLEDVSRSCLVERALRNYLRENAEEMG